MKVACPSDSSGNIDRFHLVTSTFPLESDGWAVYTETNPTSIADHHFFFCIFFKHLPTYIQVPIFLYLHVKGLKSSHTKLMHWAIPVPCAEYNQKLLRQFGRRSDRQLQQQHRNLHRKSWACPLRPASWCEYQLSRSMFHSVTADRVLAREIDYELYSDSYTPVALFARLACPPQNSHLDAWFTFEQSYQTYIHTNKPITNSESSRTWAWL